MMPKIGMRNHRLVLWTAVFSIISFQAYAQSSGIINIKSMGAPGDTSVEVTSMVQRAIDSCYSMGGGTIFFPPGSYLMHTVELKDNISIDLACGAKIIASKQPAGYKMKGRIKDTGSEGTPVLIFGENARNISIKGQGEIIGQPEYSVEELKPYDFIADDYSAAVNAGIKPWSYRWKKPNVSLIYLTRCENVLIENVSLLHSPFWTLHVHWCKRVKISGVYIYSELEKAVNADGIDIDGCQDVTISDCIITTADDAICLKTTINEEGYRACENVVVNNCILTTTSCALKLGTESHGDFSHILFSNCVIKNSNRGLGIFIRDGGKASNIMFTNITMECNRKPVGWWGSADAFTFVVLKRNPASRVGAINNLVVRNVIADVQGTSLIAGLNETENTINNVTLDELQIFMHPETTPDKRATSAIRIDRVSGCSVTNSSVNRSQTNPEPNWTNALLVSNTSDFSIRNFHGKFTGNGNSRKEVMLINVKKRPPR